MTLEEISLNKKKYIIGVGILILVFAVIKSFSATYDQMYADWEKRNQLTKEQKIEVTDRSLYDLDQVAATKNSIKNVELNLNQRIDEQKQSNDELLKKIEQNQLIIKEQQEQIIALRNIDNREEKSLNKELNSELQSMKEKTAEVSKEIERMKKEKEMSDQLKRESLDLPPLKGPLADVVDKKEPVLPTISVDDKLADLKVVKANDNSFFKLGKDSNNPNENVDDNSSDAKNNKKKIEPIKDTKEDEEKLGPKMDLMLGLVDALLVMGVDAPTNIGTKNSDAKDPLPVLLSVSSDALIANNYKQDYKNCLILATATGNATTERAYMRLSKMSCVSKNGEKRVEANIEGWVVGEDNKTGVSGNLVTKSGTLILKSLMAGMAQGLAQAASNTDNYITTGSPMGYGSNNSGYNASSNLAEGFGSGAGSAFKTIADFYIEMAKDLYPVIEVRGGRKVQILVKGTDPKNPIREVPYNKMFINSEYELDVNQNISIAY